MSGLGHRHITKVKAIIDWSEKGRFFIFPWADGGSLRDFYKRFPEPALDIDLIKEIVQQLVGLADALNALHNYKKLPQDKGAYRHGDLKPDNILSFKHDNRVGIWKLTDMGLAKHHVDETGYRQDPTATRFGTTWYEPPEVISQKNVPRSRQYDIWSMGCVVLELIILLLYGNKQLERLNKGMNTAFNNSSPYWAMDKDKAQVHPNVEACMDYIAQDQECSRSTAISDLLNLVRTKLLVVPLPPKNSSQRSVTRPGSVTFRAKAKEFHKALVQIQEKGDNNNNYWFTGQPRGHNPEGLVDSIKPIDLRPRANQLNVPTIQPRKMNVSQNSIPCLSAADGLRLHL